MQRNYLQLREFLEAKYPELRGRITGENYPVPPLFEVLSSIVSFLQLISLMAMVMGDSFWNYVPFVRQPPRWYAALKENAILVVIAVFLLVPTWIQKNMTTGAFEVMLDTQLIFSKLQSGAMPKGPEIITALADAGLTMADS